MINLRAPLRASSGSDLALGLLAGVAWAIAFVVLGLSPGRGTVVVLVVAGTLALGTAAVSGRDRQAAWTLTGVAVVAIVVGGTALLRVAGLHVDEVADLADRRAGAEVELVVVSDPAPVRGPWSSDRVRVRARLEAVRSGPSRVRVRVPVTVYAPASWATQLPGARMSAFAVFDRADRPGSAARLSVRGPPRPVAGAGRVQRAAGRLRDGLRAAVAGDSPDVRGLVPGMVLGDTAAVPDALHDAERVAGLSHLTAVSGANVAILLATVLGAARYLGLRRRGLLALGLVTVVGFVVVVRPEPSVLRAATMGCLTLVGVTHGIAGRGRQILAAAVLALLAVDPWLARAPGFALSVLAAGALLTGARRWRDGLAQVVPMRVAEPLAVAIVAHLATAPLVASLSGRVSLVAVAANLAAEPAVVVVTVAGVLATLASPWSADAAFVLARPAAWGAGWVAGVAHRSAGLPSADVGWSEHPGAVAALGAICLLTLTAGPAVLVAALRGLGRIVGAGWHASRDAHHPRTPTAGHPRGRARGPARRTGRRIGRHRRARRRPRGRRARARRR